MMEDANDSDSIVCDSTISDRINSTETESMAKQHRYYYSCGSIMITWSVTRSVHRLNDEDLFAVETLVHVLEL